MKRTSIPDGEDGGAGTGEWSLPGPEIHWAWEAVSDLQVRAQARYSVN